VSAVDAGLVATRAAMWLSIASVAAITTRLITGVVSDRIRRGHLYLCSGLILAGSLGMALLATANPTWMTFGAVLALGAGWGYPGVFWYSLVRLRPTAPGRLSGSVFPGALLGSTAGPALFGVVSEQAGF